jgi:hypothetical protein
MIELTSKPKIKIGRRQVLVIQCEGFVTVEELQKIREKVMEEMKDGVVVLPHYLKAITSDMDNIVFTE